MGTRTLTYMKNTGTYVGGKTILRDPQTGSEATCEISVASANVTKKRQALVNSGVPYMQAFKLATLPALYDWHDDGVELWGWVESRFHIHDTDAWQSAFDITRLIHMAQDDAIAAFERMESDTILDYDEIGTLGSESFTAALAREFTYDAERKSWRRLVPDKAFARVIYVDAFRHEFYAKKNHKWMLENARWTTR